MDLSGEDVGRIVGVVMVGTPEEMVANVYGSASLSSEELELSLAAIDRLRAPEGTEDIIEVLDAGYQEPFWLLILSLPWCEAGDGRFQPLLLAPEDGVMKIAGVVLPWNGILDRFQQDEIKNAGRLTAWWASKLEQLKTS